MADENWKEMFNYIWKIKGNTFIQFLLDAGLDVNALNKYGTTMLSYAAEWGNLEITEFLVEKGANGDVTNYDGSKPLHIAALYGRKDIVKFFLGKEISADSCDNNKSTPLHYLGHLDISSVGRESYQEIVQLLVDSNADLDAVDRDGCTPLLHAAQNLRKHIVELLIKFGANVNCCCDKEQRTVLHISSSCGWSDTVRFLVEERSDIDLNARTSSDQTPLFLAANFQHKDVVELLIKLGAKVDCSDEFQRTALHQSCLRGCLDIVKCLVSAGCDINAKDCGGHTPLYCAAYNSNSKVVEYLIDSGAHLDICTTDRSTVLHLASKRGWLDVIKSLIKRGFDLNVQDTFLHTPLHFAVQARKTTSVSCLLKAGADWKLPSIFAITAFNECFIGTSFYLEGIIVFIETGAYFQPDDLEPLYSSCVFPLLKECVLQNANLCSQAVINRFNNAELHKVYEIPVVAERLPSIENLKIASPRNVALDIAKSVEFEIQTKGYCDLLNARPNVLSCLCIRSLVEYYDNRASLRFT